MEKNQLFRKASLDSITSPEQLTDYMRVTNPSLLIILGAVLFLLLGAVTWFYSARTETTVKGDALVNRGTVSVYISGDDAADVKEGMIVRVRGYEAYINEVITHDDGTVTAKAEADIHDGLYDAEIVTGELDPISFIFDD